MSHKTRIGSGSYGDIWKINKNTIEKSLNH